MFFVWSRSAVTFYIAFPRCLVFIHIIPDVLRVV